MGFSSDVIATLSALSVEDVQLVLKKLDRNRGKTPQTTTTTANNNDTVTCTPTTTTAPTPTSTNNATTDTSFIARRSPFRVDVDISWIVRKLTKCTDSMYQKTVATAVFLVTLKSLGFAVTPVCDPNQRHSTKRSSFERRAKSIKKDIESRAARFELLQLTEKIKSATKDGVDTASLTKEREEVIKVAKYQSNYNVIPPDFAIHLHNHLSMHNMYGENSVGGSINNVLEGIYQADLPMAHRHTSRIDESDMVIANDGDFAMYVGREMIQLRNFKYCRKNKEIHSLSLGFACNNLAQLAKQILDDESNNKSVEMKLSFTKQTDKHDSIPLDLFGQYNDLEMLMISKTLKK